MKLIIGELFMNSRVNYVYGFVVSYVYVIWEYIDRNINIFFKVFYKKVKFIVLV